MVEEFLNIFWLAVFFSAQIFSKPIQEGENGIYSAEAFGFQMSLDTGEFDPNEEMKNILNSMENKKLEWVYGDPLANAADDFQRWGNHVVLSTWFEP